MALHETHLHLRHEDLADFAVTICRLPGRRRTPDMGVVRLGDLQIYGSDGVTPGDLANLFTSIGAELRLQAKAFTDPNPPTLDESRSDLHDSGYDDLVEA